MCLFFGANTPPPPSPESRSAPVFELIGCGKILHRPCHQHRRCHSIGFAWDDVNLGSSNAMYKNVFNLWYTWPLFPTEWREQWLCVQLLKDKFHQNPLMSNSNFGIHLQKKIMQNLIWEAKDINFESGMRLLFLIWINYLMYTCAFCCWYRLDT